MVCKGGDMQKQTFPNIYNLYQIINHIDNTKIMLSTFAIAEKTPLFPAMRVGILSMSVKKFRDSYPSSIVYKFKDDNLTFSIQSLKFFLLFQEKDCAWHRKHRTGLHHILYM